MTGLYLFAAAVGIPLVAWFLFAGDDGGDDGGDADGHDGIGALMLRLLPLSTIAIAAAAFGVCGLALGFVDTGAITTFLVALVAGVVAGALNTTAFRYLRGSESTASVDDRDLTGSVGRVVLPVGPTQRGRIALTVGDQQIYLSASTLPDERSEVLETGSPVLVIEVRNGVAVVSRLDAELT